jgi:hypothetical protein
MKARQFITTVAVLISAAMPAHVCAQPRQASPVEDSAALMHSLVTELRQLRLELLQERLERHSASIVRLEEQLANVRTTQQRLEQEERAQQDEVQQIDRRLAMAGAEDADRAQAHASKTFLVTTGRDRLVAARQDAARRESGLQTQIGRERQRAQSVQNALLDLRSRVASR